MVQAPSPIDSDVTFPTVQPRGAFHAPAGGDAAKVEKAIEDRRVEADIVLLKFLREKFHVIRCYLIQEVDIVVGVKLRHLVARR